MLVESAPTKVRQTVRDARRRGLRIGLVPTMGALHAGHVSLLDTARCECDFVVATLFVNPTQFGPHEDFSRYPRTPESDLELCRRAGTDLVLMPSVGDMYTESAQTIVRVTRLSQQLEGSLRPGHFDGVATVVAKLLLIAEPDAAYFGQKDFQQQLLIRQMAADLSFACEIVTCPTVREPDGLALSSRNRYLSTDDRSVAGRIWQSLCLAERLAAESPLSPREIAERMHQYLAASPRFDVQYAVIVNAQTLGPLESREQTGVALIAAKLGTTRLIDNHILQFR